jgi:hypothetical protein
MIGMSITKKYDITGSFIEELVQDLMDKGATPETMIYVHTSLDDMSIITTSVLTSKEDDDLLVVNYHKKFTLKELQDKINDKRCGYE